MRINQFWMLAGFALAGSLCFAPVRAEETPVAEAASLPAPAATPVMESVTTAEAPKTNELSPLFGHNLTSTSSVLKKGQVIAGTYLVGYGISDHFSLATSPFLILNYNTPVLGLKYGTAFTESLRFSFETIFFKSYEYLLNNYQQELIFFRATFSKAFSHSYTLHFGLGLQYYWDDLVPHSLRPIPTSNTPTTDSVGTLHEIHFSDRWGMFAEAGMLGVNYPNPYAQVGLSLFYRWKNGYIQGGASRSYPLSSPLASTDPRLYNHHKPMKNGDWSTTIYYEHEAPFHPEVQIQFLW